MIQLAKRLRIAICGIALIAALVIVLLLPSIAGVSAQSSDQDIDDHENPPGEVCVMYDELGICVVWGSASQD